MEQFLLKFLILFSHIFFWSLEQHFLELLLFQLLGDLRVCKLLHLVLCKSLLTLKLGNQVGTLYLKSVEFLLELQLPFQACFYLLLRILQLSMETLDHILVVIMLLFLSEVTADKSLSKHLNFLYHWSFLKTLEIDWILAQAAFVLSCDLGKKFFHEVWRRFLLLAQTGALAQRNLLRRLFTALNCFYRKGSPVFNNGLCNTFLFNRL